MGEYDVVKHTRTENHAILISPQGKIFADYYKQHPVKFAENTVQPHSELVQFPYQNKKLGKTNFWY
jgi:predicted amidohydrolase